MPGIEPLSRLQLQRRWSSDGGGKPSLSLPGWHWKQRSREDPECHCWSLRLSLKHFWPPSSVFPCLVGCRGEGRSLSLFLVQLFDDGTSWACWLTLILLFLLRQADPKYRPPRRPLPGNPLLAKELPSAQGQALLVMVPPTSCKPAGLSATSPLCKPLK